MFAGHVLDVPGVLLGHQENEEAKTGVTVALFPEGAVGGVAVRGASPGTRETDLLHPRNRVEKVHAVALCGGSAFGLDAAGGVMRALEEQGIGFETGVAKVPIVCAAVLFDLAVGRADVRPDAAMGYEAAIAAARSDRRMGTVGAGCGATVGKGIPGGIPALGGIGSASVQLPGGVVVAALLAVNALGDIYHPHTGEILACGTLGGQPMPLLKAMEGQMAPVGTPGANTTIGFVATNAKLDKGAANRLASVAHDGLALSIRPAHTIYDGDTIFALSTGDLSCEAALLEMAAVEAVARAACNAVRS